MEGPFNPNVTRPASYGHLAAGLIGLASIYALRMSAYFLARMIYRQFIYGMQVLVDGILHLSLVMLSIFIIIPLIAFSAVQLKRGLQLYRNQISPTSCRYIDQMVFFGSLVTTGAFFAIAYLLSNYYIFELQVSLGILSSICVANAVLLWFILQIPESAEQIGFY